MHDTQYIHVEETYRIICSLNVLTLVKLMFQILAQSSENASLVSSKNSQFMSTNTHLLILLLQNQQK